MPRINVITITPRQKLTIEKGLADYNFIMKYWKSNSPDFQEVYYNFYLKAEYSTFGNLSNRKAYFDRLAITKSSESVFGVMEDLKKMKGHREFSVSTKLLHTVNDLNPIYDSKIRDYLAKDEGVDLWWHLSDSGAPTRTGEDEKIKHDWAKLNDWYAIFLPSSDGKAWISWFDTNFPNYKSISDIKKIDFIIFATR